MSLTTDRIHQYLADHPEITVTGWAVAAGLDNSALRKILATNANPRIDTVKKLAAAVGEPIEYFTAHELPSGLAEIQRLFALLTPEEQAMIRTTVNALVAQRRGPSR